MAGEHDLSLPATPSLPCSRRCRVFPCCLPRVSHVARGNRRRAPADTYPDVRYIPCTLRITFLSYLEGHPEDCNRRHALHHLRVISKQVAQPVPYDVHGHAARGLEQGASQDAQTGGQGGLGGGGGGKQSTSNARRW